MTYPKSVTELIESRTELVVRLLEEHEPMVTGYSGRTEFKPEWMSIQFDYLPERREWIAGRVSVIGYHLLMPGPNGEERLGKTIKDNAFYGYHEDPVGMPGWVAEIVELHRPRYVLK